MFRFILVSPWVELPSALLELQPFRVLPREDVLGCGLRATPRPAWSRAKVAGAQREAGETSDLPLLHLRSGTCDRIYETLFS